MIQFQNNHSIDLYQEEIYIVCINEVTLLFYIILIMQEIY